MLLVISLVLVAVLLNLRTITDEL